MMKKQDEIDRLLNNPAVKKLRLLEATLVGAGIPAGAGASETIQRLADQLREQKAARLADLDPGTKALWRALYRRRPKPKPSSHKRSPGAGRKFELDNEQITDGIKILRSHGPMPVEAACVTLRNAGIGIQASNSTLYRHIWRPAYAMSK
jgi:hypothetical protein